MQRNMAPKTPNDAGLPSKLFPCPAPRRASFFPAEAQSNNSNSRADQTRTKRGLGVDSIPRAFAFRTWKARTKESRQAGGGHRVSAIRRGFRSDDCQVFDLLSSSVSCRHSIPSCSIAILCCNESHVCLQGTPHVVLPISEPNSHPVACNPNPCPTVTIDRYER